MKSKSKIPESVVEYITDFPEQVQEILNSVRNTILKVVPEAEETIKYGIPTYMIYNKNLLHFGGYARHVGFYPSPGALIHFSRELDSFKTSKGTVQFPLNRPMPLSLIEQITLFRLQCLKEQLGVGWKD